MYARGKTNVSNVAQVFFVVCTRSSSCGLDTSIHSMFSAKQWLIQVGRNSKWCPTHTDLELGCTQTRRKRVWTCLLWLSGFSRLIMMVPIVMTVIPVPATVFTEVEVYFEHMMGTG